MSASWSEVLPPRRPRRRRVFGMHLDAWAMLSFGVGYLVVQPWMAGYRAVIALPWSL